MATIYFKAATNNKTHPTIAKRSPTDDLKEGAYVYNDQATSRPLQNGLGKFLTVVINCRKQLSIDFGDKFLELSYRPVSYSDQAEFFDKVYETMSKALNYAIHAANQFTQQCLGVNLRHAMKHFCEYSPENPEGILSGHHLALMLFSVEMNLAVLFMCDDLFHFSLKKDDRAPSGFVIARAKKAGGSIDYTNIDYIIQCSCDQYIEGLDNSRMVSEEISQVYLENRSHQTALFRAKHPLPGKGRAAGKDGKGRQRNAPEKAKNGNDGSGNGTRRKTEKHQSKKGGANGSNEQIAKKNGSAQKLFKKQKSAERLNGGNTEQKSTEPTKNGDDVASCIEWGDTPDNVKIGTEHMDYSKKLDFGNDADDEKRTKTVSTDVTADMVIESFDKVKAYMGKLKTNHIWLKFVARNAYRSDNAVLLADTIRNGLDKIRNLINVLTPENLINTAHPQPNEIPTNALEIILVLSYARSILLVDHISSSKKLSGLCSRGAVFFNKVIKSSEWNLIKDLATLCNDLLALLMRYYHCINGADPRFKGYYQTGCLAQLAHCASNLCCIQYKSSIYTPPGTSPTIQRQTVSQFLSIVGSTPNVTDCIDSILNLSESIIKTANIITLTSNCNYIIKTFLLVIGQSKCKELELFDIALIESEVSKEKIKKRKLDKKTRIVKIGQGTDGEPTSTENLNTTTTNSTLSINSLSSTSSIDYDHPNRRIITKPPGIDINGLDDELNNYDSDLDNFIEEVQINN